ncbi:MAG: hypothetical protein K9J06_13255 [Flavobacteriales bacterium]|nr:hypothetical protein [Flavobacteriales bacterium]
MAKGCVFLLMMLQYAAVLAQGNDTVKAARPVPQWGIEVNYGLLSYTESGVISAGVVHTRGKHAFALSTHIWHHDLFTHPDNWARLGAAFTYSFFPIGSHRMFAPYLFYDLNYGFHGVRREVKVTTVDGDVYGAVRDAENHTLAHHLGIGVRGNIHRNFFAHLGIGAGPGSYGDVVSIESRNPTYADQRTSEHPFTHFEPVFMFRLGVVYQLDVVEWKKKSRAF